MRARSSPAHQHSGLPRAETLRVTTDPERRARRRPLPYGHHDMEPEDVAAVVAALQAEAITQGTRIAEFEEAIAKQVGAAFAVAFSSGTAALHGACVAAGVGPGDEVMTTPLTFVATANAAIYCGAVPRFADIDAETLNLDPQAVGEQLTPRTRAILPIDFAGHPAALEEFMALARPRGVTVIEDASHALGATRAGRPVGVLADMTVFSFHPVKHITTGEGGMVVTNERRYVERLRRFRHHGIARRDGAYAWNYEVVELGHNYRITDVQCALGLSQLARLADRLARRRRLAALYREGLADLEGLRLPAVGNGVDHAWHIYVVRLALERFTIDRDGLIAALRDRGIGATLHYPLVHLQPFYRQRFGYAEGICPMAEREAVRLLTLPLFPSMTDDDVEYVAATLREILNHHRR